MMYIGKEYKFEAGHYLYDPELTEEENDETFGKCVTPHGHSYTFIVEVGGPLENGMVMNYYALDDIVVPIANYLDHTSLNELPEFKDILTTAEYIAKFIFDRVFNALFEIDTEVFLESVTVKETVKTFARIT